MKKFAKGVWALLLICNLLVVTVSARELVAVGQVVGLELHDGTVRIASFEHESGGSAREAGLQIGDQIVQIDGRSIGCVQDIRDALRASRGSVTIRILRGGKEMTLTAQPEITAEGPKLGVYLRQGVTGIGTVSWYDPQTGMFGTLGHGVVGSDGALLDMTGGNAYAAKVSGVQRGVAGTPGRLMGTAVSGESLGTLTKNTAQGVFGTGKTDWAGRTMETAAWEALHTGEATILATVEGDTVREYSVEILKIYPNAAQSGRNFLIAVTDPELLSRTGGIVQGMSGSPILQDGKLVGAVTHVLVNDPTRGYGIFIENMLEAAS